MNAESPIQVVSLTEGDSPEDKVTCRLYVLPFLIRCQMAKPMLFIGVEDSSQNIPAQHVISRIAPSPASDHRCVSTPVPLQCMLKAAAVLTLVKGSHPMFRGVLQERDRK